MFLCFCSVEWTKVIESNEPSAPVIYAHPTNESSIRIVKKCLIQNGDYNHGDAIPSSLPGFLRKVDNLDFYFMDALGCSLNTFLESLTTMRTRFKWEKISRDDIGLNSNKLTPDASVCCF